MNVTGGNRPYVSIVVISKDRHELLLTAIESLLCLDYPKDRYEILVVEEGDAPCPIDGVKYIFLPRRDLGLGYARNAGVKNATGDIVAFTDDDCIIDRLWLKELAAAFEDPLVGGVAGATFAQPGSLIGVCEDVLGFPGGGHRRYHEAAGKVLETHLLSGCNCAYRRDVFARWMFKEDGYGRLGADDFLMGQNVAGERKCLYVPTAIVYHKPRGSFLKIVRWFSRRKINELLYAEKSDGGKNLRNLFFPVYRVVLFRAIMLLVIPLLFGWSGLAFTGAIGVAWYIFILLKNLPVVRYFERRDVVFLVPIVRLFMDIGVLVGEWRYLSQDAEALGSTLKEYRR